MGKDTRRARCGRWGLGSAIGRDAYRRLSSSWRLEAVLVPRLTITVARLELLKRFLECGWHCWVCCVKAVPRVRVERQPVRRVGQADRMEQRDVGESVTEETRSLVGDGNVKSKCLMYHRDEPEPRCRRAPSVRERGADFLDARGMTQEGCEPRKVWRVRAGSVPSVGKLVRFILMGFTNTDRGCVGMTFVQQYMGLLLDINTRANIAAAKQFGEQCPRNLCRLLFHWYTRMQLSRL